MTASDGAGYESAEILVDIEGPVAFVTLNRPARRNALSRTLLESLKRACEVMRENDEVRTAVFQGEGPDFSVGVDLKDEGLRAVGRAPIAERRRLLQLGPDLMAAIQALPQTTIAAMHGHCLGGGGCIALACDLRVAASDIRFGMPEALRGMTMTWRSVPLMLAHFGPARTKELLITRGFIEADRALSWGLANRVVPGSAREARDAAASWAREIAEQVPPVTAAMIKQTVNALANVHAPMMHMETDQYILSQQTEDFGEAVSSFLEKRPPKFRGR